MKSLFVDKNFRPCGQRRRGEYLKVIFTSYKQLELNIDRQLETQKDKLIWDRSEWYKSFVQSQNNVMMFDTKSRLNKMSQEFSGLIFDDCGQKSQGRNFPAYFPWMAQVKLGSLHWTWSDLDWPMSKHQPHRSRDQYWPSESQAWSILGSQEEFKCLVTLKFLFEWKIYLSSPCLNPQDQNLNQPTLELHIIDNRVTIIYQTPG